MSTFNLSKTDYILYRECRKNVWFKIHQPEKYFEAGLTEFERLIMETGEDVEIVARRLFPTGLLIEGRGEEAQKATQVQLRDGRPILFQPILVKDGYLAAIDILTLDPESGQYSIYEVKSTTDVDKNTHYHDLAFQVNLLRNCGILINKSYLIHLDSPYIRGYELDESKLFTIVDVSMEVEGLTSAVATDAAEARAYLSQTVEPKGPCSCIYKGRSRHCSTFKYTNPHVPDYSVHDIARIGSSKAKLKELVDNGIFHLDKLPAHIKLTEIQQRQVETYTANKIIIEKEKIRSELNGLTFPLFFLDYETFPAAIPRYSGFSPYTHIPFQYSAHVLKSLDSEPSHFEFIHVTPEDPSDAFLQSLQKHLCDVGSVIVWHKTFECGRNNELAARIPAYKAFIDSLNARIYDLEDIFRKQYHIHRDYRGSSSIKRVLPVLVPELSYDDLEIKEGGAAAEVWNRIATGILVGAGREKAIMALKTYCGRDSFAMYSIWRTLMNFL